MGLSRGCNRAPTGLTSRRSRNSYPGYDNRKEIIMNFVRNYEGNVVLSLASTETIFWFILAFAVIGFFGAWYMLQQERLKREHEEREALRKARERSKR